MVGPNQGSGSPTRVTLQHCVFEYIIALSSIDVRWGCMEWFNSTYRSLGILPLTCNEVQSKKCVRFLMYYHCELGNLHSYISPAHCLFQRAVAHFGSDHPWDRACLVEMLQLEYRLGNLLTTGCIKQINKYLIQMRIQRIDMLFYVLYCLIVFPNIDRCKGCCLWLWELRRMEKWRLILYLVTLLWCNANVVELFFSCLNTLL